MKARVKETGATFHVLGVISNTAEGYALDEVDLYCDESDNLVVGVSEDYWEKLKHQYAGMAMQGILSNQEYVHSLVQRVASREIPNLAEGITNHAEQLAHDLVEKMKEGK